MLFCIWRMRVRLVRGFRRFSLRCFYLFFFSRCFKSLIPHYCIEIQYWNGSVLHSLIRIHRPWTRLERFVSKTIAAVVSFSDNVKTLQSDFLCGRHTSLPFVYLYRSGSQNEKIKCWHKKDLAKWSSPSFFLMVSDSYLARIAWNSGFIHRTAGFFFLSGRNPRAR